MGGTTFNTDFAVSQADAIGRAVRREERFRRQSGLTLCLLLIPAVLVGVIQGGVDLGAGGWGTLQGPLFGVLALSCFVSHRLRREISQRVGSNLDDPIALGGKRGWLFPTLLGIHAIAAVVGTMLG